MVLLQRLMASPLFSIEGEITRLGRLSITSRWADGERFVVGTVISERTQEAGRPRERGERLVGRKRVTTIIGKLPAVE